FAISIGMVLANKIAVKEGILKETDAKKIKELLKNAGLPIVTMRRPTKKDISTDKKREGDYVKLIVPKRIGEVTITKIPCT
ncbi:3-dehydroquinate synthase, partial [Candidatus Peregrinibacteria bacterium]|nr:3-dehydroquinate synthase [Candidatus Peregrinibacteria bacterium]